MLYKSFLTLLILFSFQAPPNDEAISWKDGMKLTWNHFKGAPKTNVNVAAVTASGISFQFSINETDSRVVNFSTQVFAHFYPNKSWYIKEKGDARILAHEQLHFDITELHARKFRKEIEQLKVSNKIREQLHSLNQKINQELAATQNRYDSETDSSLNFEKQAEWHTFVNKELKKYEAYKSTD